MFHLARRRGCILVSNLKFLISLFSTTLAGTEASIGETILQIPEI